MSANLNDLNLLNSTHPLGLLVENESATVTSQPTTNERKTKKEKKR